MSCCSCVIFLSLSVESCCSCLHRRRFSIVMAVRCWSSLSLMCVASSLRGTTTLHPNSFISQATGCREHTLRCCSILHRSTLPTSQLFGQGSGNLGHVGFPFHPRYIHFSAQYWHSHSRFTHESACRFNSFTSPTHSHPFSLCQQRTRTSWALRRWYLSNTALHSLPLHMGQGFPSLCSLVAASSDK